MKRKVLGCLIGIILAGGSTVFAGDDVSVLGMIVAKKQPSDPGKGKAGEKESLEAPAPVKEPVRPVVEDIKEEKAVIPGALLVSDETDKRVESMKAYHEALDERQKEIDIIKLDLEKQKLLLEKKEAQKHIADINENLPSGKAESSEASILSPAVKNPATDSIAAADVKVVFIVVSDKVKEAILNIKGAQRTVRESDKISDLVTVEKISKEGVLFSSSSGTGFTVNFIE